MLIVKLGGGDFDIDVVAVDLSRQKRPLVVLHGANRLRDRMATDLGRPSQVVESVSGYSSVLTDDDAIDVLLAAYAGIRNKRIVEALRKQGVDAIGLTGLDGGLVRGEQNQGIRVKRGDRKVLLRDQSGKPKSINGTLLRGLLADGYVPVLTVPIVGEDGAALNTENDEVLALLSAELAATDVVSLIEEVGLLVSRDDPSTLVRTVEVADLAEWEERVDGRMRRKIRALRSLFDRAATPGPRVRISDGRGARPVTDALGGAGTLITRGAVDGGSPPDPVPATSEDAGGWLSRQARHELDVYGKRGITLVSGSGCRVRDDEGREYIDCVGGHGALALGHRHPALEAALVDQASRIWFVPGSYGSPPRTRLLERLHEALPPELDRTFLSNSGTEAIEAALKIARAHTGRSDFVAAMRGFHGRTLGALSITAEARYRDPFGPLLGEVRRIPFNKPEALAGVVDASVAAVVLEPVQGEGGVHAADPDFLRAARAACDAHGALLVFDEVQTGFGRTGHLFAFEHSGVIPDVLCLAKSIAGGLPLGATVVRSGIGLGVGEHGSTFGGNPIACAVGRATLDVLLDSGVMAEVDGLGARMCRPIQDGGLPVVREVRQIGLMIGIQLKVPARPYVSALQERGVLALTAGRTVLRLLPPLVITAAEAEAVGAILLDVLSEDRPTDD
ncbi:MAG: aminotransferase class III-fold pyridoxal phosphate-dependent enzyme [Gemmatimonadetes bacterium]|nr:aminotransferase class III-fold pyridoxal phosphate-dependent enzyme [Gemmatimonadota bacterium]MDA1102564.1 aminotransferase class III-fold pyridoxal phosphate-dependent enzyme [Gemmatimonadota bacterium]